MKQFNCPLVAQLTFVLLFISGINAFAQPRIQLQQFATGYSSPVDIAQCGDNRLFIVERRGVIKVIDTLGAQQSTPFLSITSLVTQGGGEQGLLGLAFHPDFKNNGYFYVNYIRTNQNTRISRFSVMPGDSTIADPNSEAVMLDIVQPFSNHNGGCLKFGPDGYLYIGMGDGGSAGDPGNRSQNGMQLLGKMLRIDVNYAEAPYYQVPADNPFVNNASFLPEIWSLGLRNPWRFSFDRLNGDMWIGDVGQGLWEEIDHEPANTGGRNYGWRCYEGNHTYTSSGCGDPSLYTPAAFEYGHGAGGGCSVTGGFVYRGSKYADLYGKYIFVDYCTGRWWTVTPKADGTYASSVLATITSFEYSSLGEDAAGELYVAGLGSGKIFKINELCSNFNIAASSTDATCASLADGSAEVVVTGGLAPLMISWTGNVGGTNLENIGPGTYEVTVKDANQCTRKDTVVVNEISPVAGVPVISFTDSITALCNGAPINIIANQPADSSLSFAWYLDGQLISGQTESMLQVTDAGEYTVRWKNSQTGCESMASEQTEILFETLVLFGLTYQNGILQPDEPFISGQWYFEGVPIPGAIGDSYIPLESGNYSLVVTSANGCTGGAGLQVMVSSTATPGSITQFSVAPNPTNDWAQVVIKLASPQKTVLMLMDNTGKVVLQKSMEGDMLTDNLNLSNFPAGNYFCCLLLKEGTAVRKVVKK